MKNFKSVLSIVLAVMMVASMIVLPVSAESTVDVWDGTADTSWYSDSASEFTLTTAEQLAGLAALVNTSAKTFAGKTVKLGADIQLQDTVDPATYATWGTAPAGIRVWTCIGGYNVGSFRGTFDGQGHTISGMYAPPAADPGEGTRSALFGYCYGNTVIKNVNVVNSYVQNTACTAVLVAFSGNGIPSFENVTVSDALVNGGTDGTGLLVGKAGSYSKFDIVNCDISGTAKGNHRVGGFLGYSSGQNCVGFNVENCSTDITVIATNGSSYAGGFIGYFYHAKTSKFADVSIVNNDGVERTLKVNVTGGRDSGGFFGYLNSVDTIGNVVIDGINADITFDSHSFPTSVNYQGIGGVFGYINSAKTVESISISNSNFSGTLNVGQNSGVIIGRTSTDTVVNSISLNKVKSNVTINTKKGGGDPQCIGFVVGLVQGKIGTLKVDDLYTNNAYNALTTNVNNDSYGGLVGSDGGITNVIVERCVMNDTYDGIRVGAGALFGETKASNIKVSNSIITSVITGDSASSNNRFGGLIGRTRVAANLTVENSMIRSAIESKGTEVGGLVGTAAANLAITLKNTALLAETTGNAIIGTTTSDVTATTENFYLETNSSELGVTAEVQYGSADMQEVYDVYPATGEWGVGSDDSLYPIGINYPGHEHVYGNWLPNDDGITETHYCEIFGCEASETQDRPVTCTCGRGGSDWTAWRVYKPATCDEDGLSFRTCKGCGVVEWHTVTAGHKWGEWTVSCSDDADGDGYANQVRQCYGTCGGTETGALVSVSHDAIWTTILAPTATTTGTSALVCNDCQTVLDTTTIPALGVTPVAPVIPVEPVVPTYTDIAGHKYADDIEFVTEYGLFNGMGNNKFEPETTMTRGMIITVLARLARVDVTAYTNTFTDVAADSYYAPYVGWAEAAEITNGFGDGTFRPDDEITKEQAITMIVRYLTFINNKDNTSANKADFTDIGSVSDWAADSVAEAIRLGIVEADATTLRPTDDATRAELANFFANLAKYLTK